jgi:hypothetical protein
MTRMEEGCWVVGRGTDGIIHKTVKVTWVGWCDLECKVLKNKVGSWEFKGYHLLRFGRRSQKFGEIQAHRRRRRLGMEWASAGRIDQE